MTLFVEFGDRWFWGWSLETAAQLAAAGDDAERAARLLGAADAVWAAIGAPLPAWCHERHDRALGDVRSRLGEDRFEAACDEGRLLPIGETIELVQPARGRAGADAPEGLTTREVEVSRPNALAESAGRRACPLGIPDVARYAPIWCWDSGARYPSASVSLRRASRPRTASTTPGSRGAPGRPDLRRERRRQRATRPRTAIRGQRGRSRVDARRPHVRLLHAKRRQRSDPRPLARDASRARAPLRLPLAAPTRLGVLVRTDVVPGRQTHRRQDSWRADEYWATIRIVSLTTKKWTSVTKPHHFEDFDPAWSPDGHTIAFARRLNGGTPTLYLVHPDGSALLRLTKGRSPSWSPDGKRLAFVLGGSIYEMLADGRGRKRILRGLRNPLVRWSPDGRKLLYTSESSVVQSRYNNDVWTADVDGTHRRRILHLVAIDGIAWRPGS